MISLLPSTPAEVLDISNRALRIKVKTACILAKLLGYWRRPYQGAATSFEEMTLTDIYYWVHKARNPITTVEKGETVDSLLMTDPGIVGLPAGFETQARVTLGAGGDLLRAEGIEHSRDLLFENVADLLFDQTVSFANYESPVTHQPLVREVIGDRGPPIECASREHFDILTRHKDRRFTVLNTANNHILDMGIEGVDTTQRVLSEEGILDVGTNQTLEEHGRGRTLTRDGITLGFAATSFGLNGHVPPPGEEHRVNVSALLSRQSEPDLDLLKRQIDDCKAKGCDVIIASLHWGYEFELFPRRRQVEATRALVEWGADAVLAHHPHVIQPVEYYRTRRDPRRVAVIAHSLGSLTWGFIAPHIVLSLIVNLTLAKGRIDGEERTYIEAARATPVFRSVLETDGRLVSRIEKLADHLDRPGSRHSPEYLSAVKRYADLVLGDWAAVAPGSTAGAPSQAAP